MCAVYGGGAFGGVQCILGKISALGYTVSTFVGRGKVHCGDIRVHWGEIISALGVFHNNSDIPPMLCTHVIKGENCHSV